MLYCAKNYGRCFIRVYEDKMPVIILCTVQHYTIIGAFADKAYGLQLGGGC